MSTPTLLLAGVALVPSSPRPPVPRDAAQEAAAQEKEPEWTGAVTVGVKISEGNTVTRSGNLTADAKLERPRDITTANLLWVYDEADPDDDGDYTLNERRAFGKGQYDYKLTDRTTTFVNASAEANEKADLDLRWTAGAGVGQILSDDEGFKFKGDAGLAWVDEEFGTGATNEYLAAQLGYDLFWQLAQSVEFAQKTVVLPSLEDSDDLSATVDSRLKATLTESMFAQLQYLLAWDHTPAAGKKQSDHVILLSIGWSF